MANTGLIADAGPVTHGRATACADLIATAREIVIAQKQGLKDRTSTKTAAKSSRVSSRKRVLWPVCLSSGRPAPSVSSTEFLLAAPVLPNVHPLRAEARPNSRSNPRCVFDFDSAPLRISLWNSRASSAPEVRILRNPKFRNFGQREVHGHIRLPLCRASMLLRGKLSSLLSAGTQIWSQGAAERNPNLAEPSPTLAEPSQRGRMQRNLG